jgi:hypothetical protein
MAVGYRPMKPKDVPRCVENLAAHPVLGPRYGNLTEHFPSAVQPLLGRDSLHAEVFEEFQGSTTIFLGAGLSALVSDDFLHELKTIPLFWLGPELVKRIIRGDSPLLSDSAVQVANSTVGLNLVVWHCTIYPKDMIKPETGKSIMNAFEAHWRGFRLREMIAQGDCLEHVLGSRNTGAHYFHRTENRYGNFPEVTAQDFAAGPINFGLTREIALSASHMGSWLGSLFVCGTPQFCFNRSEQRLLSSALGGGTDEELSDELGISVYAVKKAWRMIYDRVAECQPGMVPSKSQSEEWTQDRGKQKKQRLLAYLREHPEELRPVSRRLLKRESGRPAESILRQAPPDSLPT